MSALRPMPTPAQVEVDAGGTINIIWRDGHASSFVPASLRARCPCAGCVDEWTKEVKIRPEDIAADLSVRSINRVGNYALSFTWSDGHSTGIYAYDRLRAMCPCAACAGS